ncbi:restriction endonuclease subunit S [Shewanella algae]|uniref:restriction endonuclease subunit S n=1 Tax=Shewanella algae TaxID=38313 RepID=UPI0031F49C89
MDKQHNEGSQLLKFGDVAEHISERANPVPGDEKRYIGLEHLDSGSLQIKRWGSDVVLKGQKLAIKKGDILFAKRNAYLKRVALAPFDGIFSAHGMVMRPTGNKILPEFLPYFMQSDAFMNRAIAISEGSLSPTIKWKTLESQEFEFPPIESQKRALRLLEKINQCIECYEEASLSASELCESIIGSELSKLGKECTTVGDLIDSGDIIEIQDGNHGNDHPKASEYVSSGIPFVMASDLSFGKVDMAGCKKLAKDRADKLRIGFSYPGDILLSHKGTVGLVAVTPAVSDYIMLTPQVTYYRVNESGRLLAKFLEVYFRSRSFQKILKSLSAQSTRAYIGITAQKKLPVPLLSVNKQSEIINIWNQFQNEATLLSDAKSKSTRLATCIINGA